MDAVAEESVKDTDKAESPLHSDTDIRCQDPVHTTCRGDPDQDGGTPIQADRQDDPDQGAGLKAASNPCQAVSLNAPTQPVGGSDPTPPVGGSDLDQVFGQNDPTQIVDPTLDQVFGQGAPTPTVVGGDLDQVVGQSDPTPLVGGSDLDQVVGQGDPTPPVGGSDLEQVFGQSDPTPTVVGGDLGRVVGQSDPTPPVGGGDPDQISGQGDPTLPVGGSESEEAGRQNDPTKAERKSDPDLGLDRVASGRPEENSRLNPEVHDPQPARGSALIDADLFADLIDEASAADGRSMARESKTMVDASWAALDKGTKQLGGAFKSTASWMSQGAMELKRKSYEEWGNPRTSTEPSQTPPSEEDDGKDGVWLGGFTKKFSEQWNTNVAKVEEATMKAMENTQKSVHKAMKAMDHKLQPVAQDSDMELPPDSDPDGKGDERVDSSWMALDKGTKQLDRAFKSTASWVSKGARDFKRKTQGTESMPKTITVEDTPPKPKPKPVKAPPQVEEEDDIFAIESDESGESALESGSSEVRGSACAASKTPTAAPAQIGPSTFVKLTKGEKVPKADIMTSPLVARFPFKKKRAKAEANWWSKAMSNVVSQALDHRLACLCINQLIVFEEIGEELVCKSNRRINTIKRMSYESKRPNQVEFFYRTMDKTNVYLFDDAEVFIKTLQERLIALNIGMKTNRGETSDSIDGL